MRAQPSPQLEAENAAYVWVGHCLNQHISECRNAVGHLSDEQWTEIAWTFERLRIAQETHQAMEKARLGK